MRVALVVSELPSASMVGAGSHAVALADALADLGHQVELFAPRELAGLEPLAQRREEHPRWARTWLNVAGSGELAGLPGAADVARAFGAFLDRERPEVVHFEGIRATAPAGHAGSLRGLGVDLVGEAKRRGLGTVCRVHDFELASESPFLLRPDLAPQALGDREAEVRSALVRHELTSSPGSSDHGDYVVTDDLGPEARAHLHQLLEGSYDLHPEAERLRGEVRASLERKHSAFAALDRRFASSRTIARRLSGALGRAVDWRPLGVRQRPRTGHERAAAQQVRLLYVGAIEKAGGLHLLLEAFAPLVGKATLAVHGDGEDRPYLTRCRELARELGATWGGPIGPDGVDPLFTDGDVLVVPRLGEDGSPFVARRAQAAGLPVVAPRTEALSEVVRDELDGILFDRGQVEALHSAMARFTTEEWLLTRLSTDLRPPRALRDEAEEWSGTYEELGALTVDRLARPRVPAGWEGLAGRYRDLSARSDRELFGIVMEGLDALGAQMGLQVGPREFLATAVGRGSRLRDGLVEGRRALDWMSESVAEHAAERRTLDENLRIHEARVAELRGRLEELGAEVRGRDTTLEQVSTERDSLLRDREDGERDRAALGDQLVQAKSSLEMLERERAFLEQTLEEGTEELRLLRERITSSDHSDLDDREALELHFECLREELGGLLRHDDFIRNAMTEFFEVLGGSGGDPGQGEEPALRVALEDGQDRLSRLISELAWRRGEVAEARQSAESLFSRIGRGDLASRVRTARMDGEGEMP